MGIIEEHKNHNILKRKLFAERCSTRGKNQKHFCSVLPTYTSSARVWGRASRHLDSDETVLGWRTVWETFVNRHQQNSEDHQQRKVRISFSVARLCNVKEKRKI